MKYSGQGGREIKAPPPVWAPRLFSGYLSIIVVPRVLFCCFWALLTLCDVMILLKLAFYNEASQGWRCLSGCHSFVGR